MTWLFSQENIIFFKGEIYSFQIDDLDAALTERERYIDLTALFWVPCTPCEHGL